MRSVIDQMTVMMAMTMAITTAIMTVTTTVMTADIDGPICKRWSSENSLSHSREFAGVSPEQFKVASTGMLTQKSCR